MPMRLGLSCVMTGPVPALISLRPVANEIPFSPHHCARVKTIIIGADRVVATTRAATFIVHRFIACALAATAFCFL